MIQIAEIQVAYAGDTIQVVGQILGSGHSVGLTPRRWVSNVRMDELGAEPEDAELICDYVRTCAERLESELRGAWGGQNPLF